MAFAPPSEVSDFWMIQIVNPFNHRGRNSCSKVIGELRILSIKMWCLETCLTMSSLSTSGMSARGVLKQCSPASKAQVFRTGPTRRSGWTAPVFSFGQCYACSPFQFHHSHGANLSLSVAAAYLFYELRGYTVFMS